MDENTPAPRVQIIENVTRDDVRPGDHMVWEHTETFHGVTRTVRREGIAHHRDELGDWQTGDDGLITDGEDEGITLTIRRPVQDVPTEPGEVIVNNDGGEYITATVRGVTYRAREAILLAPDHWHAAWRSDEGVLPYVIAERIDAGTWKKANR